MNYFRSNKCAWPAPSSRIESPPGSTKWRRITSFLQILKYPKSLSPFKMQDLSNSQLRQVYMDHCARLMSMQKLFRFNPEAAQAEQLVFDACFELRKLLEPHMTPEESDELGLRLIYAQP